jgi:Raf kinase inhibitor-like YbhB/YbcL family protein
LFSTISFKDFSLRSGVVLASTAATLPRGAIKTLEDAFMIAKGNLRLAALAAMAALFAASSADAAGTFTLSSTTFQDGKLMPKKVANSRANAPSNPNCVGENVSPQLSWTNVPDGTKSFVLLMTDPEGRGGAGVNHWVAYGIPASVTGFAEGEVSKPSDKYVGGKSTQGVGFYSGPCTPPGQVAHHYTFVLIATDFDPHEMAPGLTRDDVIAKLAAPGQPPAHTKGVAGMVGLFVNPYPQ